MEKRVFTEQEAAVYINMSCSFLRQDRINGLRKNRTRGPKPIKIGRSVRYLKEALDAWLDAFYTQDVDSFTDEF